MKGQCITFDGQKTRPEKSLSSLRENGAVLVTCGSRNTQHTHTYTGDTLIRTIKQGAKERIREKNTASTGHEDPIRL